MANQHAYFHMFGMVDVWKKTREVDAFDDLRRPLLADKNHSGGRRIVLMVQFIFRNKPLNGMTKKPFVARRTSRREMIDKTTVYYFTWLLRL